ncbi:hypothetical protein [Tepidibacter hydrothermalis]|uniref:DUF4236 domain-containing protein n=1 Tax=Tepidibacter hydrothermalis TaxID=3036126 RepID=A0ABY8E743_9FIRM|nr:hypothetical protein [Tepidibacter hydrothermalis]WFD08703.1 hypothetical protein P4S50_09850 [Tepidibacter hydrothermalis]
MGFRFRKSINLGGEVRLNLGKKSTKSNTKRSTYNNVQSSSSDINKSPFISSTLPKELIRILLILWMLLSMRVN